MWQDPFFLSTIQPPTMCKLCTRSGSMSALAVLRNGGSYRNKPGSGASQPPYVDLQPSIMYDGVLILHDEPLICPSDDNERPDMPLVLVHGSVG